MDFKHIDKRYRPVPFWSWNEKLTVEESLRQTAQMDQVGIGGYFMHARGGLQTEYMGDEWFENVEACIRECQKRGMHAWAYDENGWPSGFGDGKVNGKGEAYWQKYLRVMPADGSKEEIPAHRIICQGEKYCFYYEVNPFYVDTLDPAVTADFIREVYEPYYERFGATFDGFFTDEPQISRNGIPWSLTLIGEYRQRYGEDLCDVLACLFYEEGDYAAVRVRFWKMITDLFSQHFMKQIYDWCVEHGLQFTGHLVLEEFLENQLVANGACMPHYEYLSIPGMDWLGRDIYPCLTHHQVASAAAQVGRKQVLSETFALCGHNVGHDELRRNYEWMMVRGINLMCQHLEGYSNRGIRKRDYPPAMYIQQPWWADYTVFNDAMSRIGMLLARGEIRFDTLLMHNQTSAWIAYNDRDNTLPEGKNIADYNQALVEATLALEAKHIPFHLGDETLIERHGRVEGNRFIIGEQSYTTIVLPEHIRFMEGTQELLDQFAAGGGRIVTDISALSANPIIDNENITYTRREFEEFTLHYFVNSHDSDQPAVIARGSYAIDPATGERLPFTGEHTFPPYTSLLVIDDGSPRAEKEQEKERLALDITGLWQVQSATDNAITLDKCDYWFDGVLQEENGYVLNILPRTTELRRPVDVRCVFKAELEYVPDRLYIAVETPEIFTIRVNGQEINKKDCGYFRDRSFRLLDIRECAKVGVNEIELLATIQQSPETYENIEKAKVFESEKNKLTYDMEIEAIYLVGDFRVKTQGTFEPTPHEAYFFDGTFTVVPPDKEISLCHLEQNGYPFFSGELCLSKGFTLDRTDYMLAFEKKGFNALRVKVNGQTVGTTLWAPYQVDLSPYLKVGTNQVELTIVNNLRNLLGPHHHTQGELLAVTPHSFYKEPCVWNGFQSGYYTERYCFVDTGLL